MKNEIIIVTGKRGKGKSTYVKHKIFDYDRVVIYDLLGEYTFSDYASSIKDFMEKFSKCRKKPYFTLAYYNPKSSDYDFNIICEAVNRSQEIIFVLDELDHFCSPHFIPKGLAEIVKRGRHQNLQVMVATRRPHELPPLIRSQYTTFISFNQSEERDLKYLQDVAGFDPDRIRQLQDMEFLQSENGIITSGKVEIFDRPLKIETEYKDDFIDQDEDLLSFESSETDEFFV